LSVYTARSCIDAICLKAVCKILDLINTQTPRQEQKVTYREVVNVWGYQQQNNNNNNGGGAEIKTQAEPGELI